MATTSWGGSVIGPTQNKDGKYWMFAAEMAQHCTLGQWTTNSQVVTAVSDTYRFTSNPPVACNF